MGAMGEAKMGETGQKLVIEPARRRRAARPAGPEEAFTSLRAARKAVQDCRRCPLYAQATQPVLGAGPAHAALMMAGEQPGDSEDLAGSPFVGPAGRLLDAMLEAARIDRKALYVTNAVKHFKFVPRGKRRLHQRPNGRDGGQQPFGLAGGDFQTAGQTDRHGGRTLFVTVHPSYLLRMADRDKAAREREAFARDLALARDHLESVAGASVMLDTIRADP